jgi:pyruvate/2-oxoglutarate dehydrogenase complex dihydrolipoamide dehydrogenase (E3) component
LGIDVFIGDAHFEDRRSIKIKGGATLKFKKAVIATGSRAAPLIVKGIEEIGYLTNETVFNLTSCPKRLLVVGGGPLGCELAQAFARLGSRVTIASRTPYFLPTEERDAAEILANSLRKDGIDVRLNTEVIGVLAEGRDKRIILLNDNVESSVVVDEILTGVGRIPNVQGLNLEVAGVKYDKERGVLVSDYLQTANPNIYAIGDVTLSKKFSHLADATARMVIQNALFLGRKKLSSLTIPWCTYTDPEIAHVGLYFCDCNQKAFAIKTYTVPMSDVDRAVLDGEEEGFVKIHVREGTGTILGATIVARHAGEMINEISLAMVAGIGLKTVSEVIHSYPTQAQAIRMVAEAYRRSQRSPLLKKIGKIWLQWLR